MIIITRTPIKSRRLRKILAGNDNLAGKLSQMMVFAHRKGLSTRKKPDKATVQPNQLTDFARYLQIQVDRQRKR